MDSETAASSLTTELTGKKESDLSAKSISTGAAAPAPAATQEVTPPASGQQAVTKPTGDSYDVDWWKKDARFGKIWKDVNDFPRLYKSADEILEKKYKPTFKQYEDLQKKFRDSGIEMEKFDDYIKEYQTLKSPENPTNIVYEALVELLGDDDITQQEFDAAMADLQEKKLQRKYPGASRELREKLIVQEKETRELKGWKNRFEVAELDKKESQNVETGLASIKKLCASKGFDFNENIKVEFINHCVANKTPTAYMVQEFRNKYDEAIDKSYSDKVKAEMLQSQQDKNKTTIPMSKIQQAQVGKKKDFISQLGEAFAKSKKE